jgi:hypothetical protein
MPKSSSDFQFLYGPPQRKEGKHFGIPMYGAPPRGMTPEYGCPARPDPPRLVPRLPADPPQNPTIMWQLGEILIKLEKILDLLTQRKGLH